MDGYCYILCANGYAEEAVEEARMILSGEGLVLERLALERVVLERVVLERLAPAFLGLKAGWIRGAAGRRVSAAVLISQVTGEEGERPLPRGLLLAGGAECGQHLLADPRVHLLVQHMLAAERPVGLLRPVCYPLYDLLAKRSGGAPILVQESQTTADFVNAFVHRYDEAGQAG